MLSAVVVGRKGEHGNSSVSGGSPVPSPEGTERHITSNRHRLCAGTDNVLWRQPIKVGGKSLTAVRQATAAVLIG